MDPDRKRPRIASDIDESNVPLADNGDSPSSFKHENSQSSRGTPSDSSGLLPPQAARASEGTGNGHAPPSEDEEEAENHTMTRMLIDPTGRLRESNLPYRLAHFMSGWRLKTYLGAHGATRSRCVPTFTFTATQIEIRISECLCLV